MLGLLTWHVWRTPKWLALLTWNLERAVARYFSVSIMLRTLVSHWHKDVVSYRQGTIGSIVLAFAWNMISRGIGFIIRTTVLLLFACVSLGIAVGGLFTIGLFLVWPVLMITGLIIGGRLIT